MNIISRPTGWGNVAISIVAALLLLAIGSCKSSKNAIVADTSNVSITKNGLHDAFRHLASDYGEWERLRVPVTLRLSSPKKMSVSGTATLIRGKSVHMSMRVFGMEVATLYLTNDSVVFVEKFSKYYVAERLDHLLSGFPVTIDNVEDLLIGRAFVLGENRLRPTMVDKVKLMSDGNTGGWIMQPPTVSSIGAYSFRFTGGNTLDELRIKYGYEDNDVMIRYSGSQSTPYGPMSEDMSVAARPGNILLEASMSFNFGKARWNGDVEERSVNIPRGYTRVNSQNLLKQLKSL